MHISSLGIQINKTLDFINCGASLIFKMRGHGIGRAADFQLFFQGWRFIEIDLRNTSNIGKAAFYR